MSAYGSQRRDPVSSSTIVKGYVTSINALSSVFCLCFLLHSSTALGQDTFAIDTMTPWMPLHRWITGFADGNGLCLSVGQTFDISGGNARVTGITFPVNSYYRSYDAPGPSEFRFAVAEWNGTRPTGSVLYLSNPFYGTALLQYFTCRPSDLVLIKDRKYIVMLTPNGIADGIQSLSNQGSVDGNAIPNGQMYAVAMPYAGVGGLFDQDWDGIGVDLAFKLEYQSVPEPNTTVLTCFGALVFALRRKL